ncbi:DNA ligase, partial [Candidatus Woesearchaeota archaeon]|nr:DNA ligase [Candidatus Woesearchaeota archaeon]
IEKMFEEAREKGNEGLMLKNLKAPYKPGARVGYMLKYKRTMENLDLTIVKAEWGEGKRSKWLSSYTVACRKAEKLLEVGKVSTGLKEKPEEGLSFEEMTKLLKPLITKEEGKEAYVKPRIVIEVAYEEIQKSPTYDSGYALRFPRVLRLRDDKGAKDASTLSMVEQYYNEQKKKSR